MLNNARGFSASDAVAAVDALLAVARPKHALEVVDSLAAQEPDSFTVHLLRARCLLELRENAGAEQSWRRATELQPEDVGIAAIGVRCAIRLQLDEQVWARAVRLRSLAPDLPLARYWYAIAAAVTKRDAIAYKEVEAVTRMDPTSDWPLHVAAEVDLVISGRKRRVAVEAEEAAELLLGRNPLDQGAHQIRLRAAALREVASRRKRPAAERRLSYLTDAARAGVQPGPGELRSVVIKAMAPLAPVLFWLVAMFLAAPLVETISWFVALVGVVILGAMTYVAGWRRIRRIAADLPAAGRTRLLRPVVRTIYTTSGVIGAIAAVLLVVLFPYTQSHALSLGLGQPSGESTRIVVVTAAPTVPTFTPPTVSIPGVPALPTVPPISIPPIPDIHEVRTRAPADPELAWTLMRYYTGCCCAALGLASALAVFARVLSTRP
jgi:hypothetical protein